MCVSQAFGHMNEPPLFEIRENSQLGRHLICTNHVRPGQVLLQQAPYQAVLYDDQIAIRCDYCYGTARPEHRLLKCSRSKFARYCCRDHQQAAWGNGYKQECQALVSFSPKVPPATIRLAARTVWRYLRETVHQDEAAPSTANDCSWASVQVLKHHWESLDEGRKIMYAQMATVARSFILAGLSDQRNLQLENAASSIEEKRVPSVKDIALLLARFACNNHTICDEELRPVGVGLFPLGALLNHCCTPNCMQSFGTRGEIHFRALRDISPGETLTISYVELAATLQERREELASTYYFDIIQPMRPPLTPSESMSSYNQHCNADSEDIPEPLQDESSDHAPGMNYQSIVSSAGKLTLLDQLIKGGSQKAVLRVYKGVLKQNEVLPPWPSSDTDALLSELTVRASLPFSPSPGMDPVQYGDRDKASVLPGGLLVNLVHESRPDFQDPEFEPLAENQLGSLAEEEVDDEEESSDHLWGMITKAVGELKGIVDDKVVIIHCWGAWMSDSIMSATNGQIAVSAGCCDEDSTLSISSSTGLKAMPVKNGEVHVEASGRGGKLSCHSDDTGSGVKGRVLTVESIRVLCQRLAVAALLQEAAETLSSSTEQQRRLAVKLLQVALQLISMHTQQQRVPQVPQDCTELQAVQRIVAGLPVLGECHIFRMRLRAAYLKALIDVGDEWISALQVGRSLTQVYRLVYPSVWPNLGLHYAALAKLELLQEHFEEGISYAQSALGILEVTHNQRPASSLGVMCGEPTVIDQVLNSMREASSRLHA
ncbi:hypothetical protein CEUSTIGMA_g6605.t1 [Chlamydomonas eustigma]|uniref:SET domain-containing protein n=1 Tax=Chlamydomonas eustigma TaxID=1157962 RepID=A0A250X7X6_9CHLO|nr:hypothetical protein CEUSTIGMA_g6605.t1 [Chlamydomonas eustigma]|eukprot:GAX79165.1 hypothetical protein CEUSTIGMA_g6605.t1 [Chlamydomonas eustigma]